METQRINTSEDQSQVNAAEQTKKVKKSGKLGRNIAIVAGGAVLLGGVGAALMAATPAKKTKSHAEDDEEETTVNENEEVATNEGENESESLEIEETSEYIPEETPVVWNDGDIAVASTPDGDMTFEEAFEAAREEVGIGGAFVWNDNVYGTYNEAEWDALTPEEQDAFCNHINWNDVKSVEPEVVENIETEVPEAPQVLEGNDLEGEDVEDIVEPIEVIDTPKPQTTNESEFEVVSINQDTEAGINYVELKVDGHESYMIDEDGDGIIDVIMTDKNDNGFLDSDEAVNIQDQGLTIEDLSEDCGVDITIIGDEEENYDEEVIDIDLLDE